MFLISQSSHASFSAAHYLFSDYSVERTINIITTNTVYMIITLDETNKASLVE